MAPRYPAIPEPIADTDSLRSTTAATKEAVEILLGIRGSKLDAAVTFRDLVNLGLITSAQVPK